MRRLLLPVVLALVVADAGAVPFSLPFGYTVDLPKEYLVKKVQTPDETLFFFGKGEGRPVFSLLINGSPQELNVGPGSFRPTLPQIGHAALRTERNYNLFSGVLLRWRCDDGLRCGNLRIELPDPKWPDAEPSFLHLNYESLSVSEEGEINRILRTLSPSSED